MANDTVIERIKSFLQRWKQDYAFKTIISSAGSFGTTVLFALYNGFLGIFRLSVWHGSICVFYLVLVAVRGMILLTEKKNVNRSERERVLHRHKTFKISSVVLLMLNLALILPISLMVIFEKPISIGLIPAIAMAAYTTYKITMAFIHMRKQKSNSYSNVSITELRVINFIDALVSVLTLQNTLIMVNQANSGTDDMLILSAVSSAVIYVIIMCMTFNLLIKGFKRNKNNCE